MGVADSIFTRCTSGHAGVSALIGTRCYPRIPDGPTFPLVRYTFVSTPPNSYRDHDGPPDRWTYRVQLDAYAATKTTARALADQLFDAFEGWESGTAVGGAFVENRFDDWDDGMDKAREMVEVVIDHSV